MPVVRSDRIAESQRLNRRSLAAQNLYEALLSRVQDDFGRFRLAPGAIFTRLYPRREPAGWDLRTLKRLLNELGAGTDPLWRTWEVDGVTFAELYNHKPTGNQWHRTPEPPWSDHQHGATCIKTALARAREWGPDAQVEALRAQFKLFRDLKVRSARPRMDADGGGWISKAADGRADLAKSPSGINDLREREVNGGGTEHPPSVSSVSSVPFTYIQNPPNPPAAQGGALQVGHPSHEETAAPGPELKPTQLVARAVGLANSLGWYPTPRELRALRGQIRSGLPWPGLDRWVRDEAAARAATAAAAEAEVERSRTLEAWHATHDVATEARAAAEFIRGEAPGPRSSEVSAPWRRAYQRWCDREHAPPAIAIGLLHLVVTELNRLDGA